MTPESFSRIIMCLLMFSLARSSHHYEKFFQVDGGPKYMYYFSKFYVGSPEIEQSAIIDTGSDTLAFPCDQCQSEDCGTHQDPRFFTKNSKSFHYEMRCASRNYYKGYQVCQFTKSYAEGSSLIGFLAEDYVRFKNARSVQDSRLHQFNSQLKKDLRLKAEFGCTTKETGLFKTQYADGILGLDNASNLIESIEQENSKSISKVFSFGLCFHATGGIMSVDLRNRDEPDDKIVMLNRSINSMSQPIVVPYTSFDNYYNVKVTGFGIMSKRIQVPAITMMVDSGTTFSHFPNLHLNRIFAHLNNYCRRNRSKCGKLPNPDFTQDTCLELRLPDNDYRDAEDLYNSFPPIKVFLAGTSKPYILYPQNYWYKEYNPDAPENTVKICMALKGNEDGKIILGAFSMIDYYFYFDRKDHTLKIFKENCYLRTSQLLVKRTDRILATVEYIADNVAVSDSTWINFAWFVFGVLIFAYLLVRILKRPKKNPVLEDLPRALSRLVNDSAIEGH